MREEVRGAKLDALIICGDDQYELFHDDNMPSIAIYYGDTIRQRRAAESRDPDWYKRAQLRRARAERRGHLSLPRAAGAASHRRLDR